MDVDFSLPLSDSTDKTPSPAGHRMKKEKGKPNPNKAMMVPHWVSDYTLLEDAIVLPPNHAWPCIAHRTCIPNHHHRLETCPRNCHRAHLLRLIQPPSLYPRDTHIITNPDTGYQCALPSETGNPSRLHLNKTHTGLLIAGPPTCRICSGLLCKAQEGISTEIRATSWAQKPRNLERDRRRERIHRCRQIDDPDILV